MSDGACVLVVKDMLMLCEYYIALLHPIHFFLICRPTHLSEMFEANIMDAYLGHKHDILTRTSMILLIYFLFSASNVTFIAFDV